MYQRFSYNPLRFAGIVLATLIFGGVVLQIPIKAQDSAEATEMCQCLESAFQTRDKVIQKRCLDLQEIHVKKLKEGSAAHKKYRESVHACERKLINRNSSDPSNMTFDEKVKHVCECFENARKDGKGPMECFRMQWQFGKTTGEKQTDFNRLTNQCAG